MARRRPDRAAPPPPRRCGPCRPRSGTTRACHRPPAPRSRAIDARALAEHLDVAVTQEVDGAGGGDEVVVGPHALDHREVVPLDRVARRRGSAHPGRSRPAVRRSITVRSPSARATSRSSPARRWTPSARNRPPDRASAAVEGGQAAEVAHVEHELELDGAVKGGGVGGEAVGGRRSRHANLPAVGGDPTASG